MISSLYIYESTLFENGTWVPEADCSPVYSLKCRANWSFLTDNTGLASTQIWYHTHKQIQRVLKHRHTHRNTN